MLTSKRKHIFGMAAAISLIGVWTIAGVTQAKEPLNAAVADDQNSLLLQVVAKGDALWHDGNLGTNGLACGNCHPDGAASNPHTWPKFQTNLGKVGTLREMINWCIAVPMQGKPLALDSADMIAMEAYAAYTHRGIAIAPGKDEQHGAVPVASGPGYPQRTQ